MARRFANRITLRFGILTFGGALAATLALHTFIDNWLAVWLIAITAITFFTYGYDKNIAGSKLMRVPEAVLLALTAFGGTLGAIVGMRFFRHKTSKDSFLSKFTLIVVAQAAAISVYYLLFRR